MVNLDIINGEIASLEQKEITYVIAEKLAWLYIVRDHIQMGSNSQTLNVSRETTPKIESTSEFLSACSEVDVESLLNILDEHMDIIKAVYPKEYTAIISRIKSNSEELCRNN